MNTDTNTNEIVVDTTLDKFRGRVWASIQKMNTLAEWCVELYEVTKINPPLSVTFGVYENLTCFGPYKYGEDPVIDIEATQTELAKVIQFARIKKYDVEKKYTEDSFTVSVTVPSETVEAGYKVQYYASRKAVCKPKVTKTVHVPASTREEVVEWDCSPIAFTKLDAGVDRPALG
jgi:HSP20 family molecular chaperone IbpA